MNHAGGFTAYRWNPTVVEREKALLTAMAQRFNSHSGFEGVSFQESATGIAQDQLDRVGYSPEKYRDALIEVLNHAGRSFSSAHAFWYMNFLERKNPYMADVLAATRGNGVVAGGPDVAPDSYSLQKHTYPILRDNIGRMPMFSQVEGLVYSHEHADNSYPTKYWTMTEIFRYARDNLKVNYLFWVLLPQANPPDSHDFYDAVPVIRANPEFN